MADRREEINDRMRAIVVGLDDVVTAGRNVRVVDELKRPAVIAYDGDDEVEDDETRREPQAPQNTTLVAGVLLMLAADEAEIGTALNLWRAKIIKAVTSDATLIALVGRNGSVRWKGSETALDPRRSLDGSMLIQFQIRYVTFPARL